MNGIPTSINEDGLSGMVSQNNEVIAAKVELERIKSMQNVDPELGNVSMDEIIRMLTVIDTGIDSITSTLNGELYKNRNLPADFAVDRSYLIGLRFELNEKKNLLEDRSRNYAPNA